MIVSAFPGCGKTYLGENQDKLEFNFKGEKRKFSFLDSDSSHYKKHDGWEKEYRDLIELIARIADYIFSKSERARKGIGEIMGGKVLELESDKLIAKGVKQGLELGKQESQIDTAVRMLQAGKYAIEEIAEISGLTVEKVNELNEKKNLQIPLFPS